jgi:AcrR family transcriptional regulator
VVVETLAHRLGTSKGSFYWHFADREALIAAALELWEREHTIEVIDHLREIPDPAERLRRLFELAFGGDVGGAISVTLYANAGNHLVAPVLERMSRRRVEFLTEVFTDLGFPQGGGQASRPGRLHRLRGPLPAPASRPHRLPGLRA